MLPDLSLLARVLSAVCSINRTDKDGHYALLGDVAERVPGVDEKALSAAVQVLVDAGWLLQADVFPWKIELSERAYGEIARVAFSQVDGLALADPEHLSESEPPDAEEKT